MANRTDCKPKLFRGAIKKLIGISYDLSARLDHGRQLVLCEENQERVERAKAYIEKAMVELNQVH